MKKLVACLLVWCLLLTCVAQEATFKPAHVQKLKWGFDAFGHYRAYSNSTYTNFKTKYFVLKKDSTGINLSSKIYVTADGRFYLSTENKESSDEAHRIYADETIKINYQDQRYQKVFEGIALDNAWLFKVLEGRITLYSCYPPPDDAANDCLDGFQIGDGAILPFDPGALKQVLQSSRKASDALEKKNYVKAVKSFNSEQNTDGPALIVQ